MIQMNKKTLIKNQNVSPILKWHSYMKYDHLRSYENVQSVQLDNDYLKGPRTKQIQLEYLYYWLPRGKKYV